MTNYQLKIQLLKVKLYSSGLILLFLTSLGVAAEYVDYPDNPVFSGHQAWNSLAITSPVVSYVDNTYNMWFMGRTSGYALSAGFAISQDGIDWLDNLPPLLTTGTDGEWDDTELQKMDVIFDGNEYKLYYTGGQTPGYNHIGLATSPDGITWTKYADNPVISPGENGSWNSNRVKGPAVVFIDGLYMMWLEGLNADIHPSIGLYTSSDGIEWTPYSQNPVFDNDPEINWEMRSINVPDVLIREDGSFLMMYGGYDGNTRGCGFATSEDGIIWHRYNNNPVITAGGPGSWNEDYVIGPNGVIRELGHYQVWYTGNNGSSTYETGFGDFTFYAMGDINYDYSHDVSDVIGLVNYILAQTEFNSYQIIVGDFTGDGSINVGDVVGLVEFILN